MPLGHHGFVEECHQEYEEALRIGEWIVAQPGGASWRNDYYWSLLRVALAQAPASGQPHPAFLEAERQIALLETEEPRSLRTHHAKASWHIYQIDYVGSKESRAYHASVALLEARRMEALEPLRRSSLQVVTSSLERRLLHPHGLRDFELERLRNDLNSSRDLLLDVSNREEALHHDIKKARS